MMWCKLGASAGAIVIGLSGGSAWASGFALREQSAKAQGNAFAGATAGAEDISYMFFNPAALARHGGYQASLSLSYVMPESKLKDAEASTIAGTAIAGDDGGDIAEDALVPALYLSAALAPELVFGLGVTAPFGLATDHDEDSIARYHALRSDLQTVNINPALAIRASHKLSFGIGAQIQYADAELSTAVDFGTIGALAGVGGAVPGAQDGKATVNVDDWAYGFTLGALYEHSDATRFGIGYRSEIDHDADGDAEFELDEAGIGAALSAATGAFVDTGASIELSAPASLSIGAYHDLNPQFALMAELGWTDWSSFEDLTVEFDNDAQEDNVTEENWEDTFFVALGATWRPLPALAVKGGIAYDESPIKDEFRTPRVPDSDRYWVTGGVEFQVASWLDLGAAYTHIFMEDADLDLEATDTGSTFRGNLSGEFENQIDIISVGATLRF